MSALVRGLARCGYTSQQWSEISDLFEREYDLERVPLQEAILELVTLNKEKQAIPMLLRNLDEPFPEDIHGQHNPPAAYWEARWKSWDKWKGKVADAVLSQKGKMIVTADHGNIEQLIDYDTGMPHTAHTTNLVPVILVDEEHRNGRLREGSAIDVAPTLLRLLGLAQPKEMTGHSLIVES